ncbi:Biotin synthase [Citrus sinensis]|nr:Biotin synthase [Citrus sinensis]
MMSFRSLLRSQRSLSLRPSKKFLALHSSCSCYSASAAAIEAERTIREGGCSEDCSYCPQSSRYDTGVKGQKLMTKDAVMQAAQKAKEAGSTRFCMGAAWRDTIGRKTNFNQILEYVKDIRDMGMEVCCTLGMLEKHQAIELKKAGLTAYNHNLDTSREFYAKIITTRSYDERLETLKHVREAGINVCSGGIIGLGEAEEDRVGLLHTLATLPTHPESVPINALLAVKGTPLQDQKPVEIWEMIRMIATARIVMPKAMVRLSAGRVRFSMPEQALCFLAGANSIFTGEKLLTTPNNDFDADQLMFKVLGLTPKAPSFHEDEANVSEAESCQEAVSHSGNRESTTSSTAAAGGAGKESMPGTTTPLTSKRAFILNDCIVSMPARLLDCMCFISKRAHKEGSL